MTMKAFAVTCDKYYPGKVVYYAAETPDGAISEARLSILKIGGQVKREDIVTMRTPEYDSIAELVTKRGCIDDQITLINEI